MIPPAIETLHRSNRNPTQKQSKPYTEAIETLHRRNRNPTQMQSKIPPQKQEKSLKLERRLQRQERKGGVVPYQGHNFKKNKPPIKIFPFS